LGKHYSASADTHAEPTSSFSVCHIIIHIFARAICIGIGDICISTFEPGRDSLAKSSADSENVTNCNAGSLIASASAEVARRSIPNRLHPLPGDPLDQLRIRQACLAR
jgi:hypothetical protein